MFSKAMSFTDKPVRFLGYGPAFGEALYPLVDYDVINACYTVGAIFIFAHCFVVMADTGDVLKVIDTLIFEIIASAVLPTAIAKFLMRYVNHGYWLLDDILYRMSASRDIQDYAPTVITILCILVLSQPMDKSSCCILSRLKADRDIRKYTPTLLTIFCLILMPGPLDTLVNQLMDMTFRKVLK